MSSDPVRDERQRIEILLAAHGIAILEHSTDVLMHTHRAGQYAGKHCTIHRRSNHALRRWTQAWCPDTVAMYRVCRHGTWYPDPDEPADHHDRYDPVVNPCCPVGAL